MILPTGSKLIEFIILMKDVTKREKLEQKLELFKQMQKELQV